MLLIHGAGLDDRFWQPAAPDVAICLPGRGKCPGPPLHSVAEMAAYAIETLPVGPPVTIAGHSLGGAVALEMAIQAAEDPASQERIAGLVLISTGGRLRVRPEILAMAMEAEKAGVPLEINGWALPEGMPQQRQLLQDIERSVPPATALADWTAADRFDRLRDLGKIRLPVRILVGEEDRLTPPKYAAFLAAQIPGATLRVFPGRGHMLPLEIPEEIGEELEQRKRS